MLNKNTIEQLAQFPSASFALWNGTSANNLKDFFITKQAELKNNVILLFQHRPTRGEQVFDNFHSQTEPDKDLKHLIQDKNLDNLKGAFMTDIVDDKFDEISRIVEMPTEMPQNLSDEIDLLGCEECTVVCFGDKTYKCFRKWLKYEDSICENNLEGDIGKIKINDKNIKVTCIETTHHSASKWNPKQIYKLEKELNSINNVLRKIEN